jgi:hypothetical protein
MLGQFGARSGVDPALPGVDVFIVPRVNQVTNVTSAACFSKGASASGFVMIASDNGGVGPNDLTMAHELGHSLALTDLSSNFENCKGVPETSSLMCEFAAEGGAHVPGCNAWRTDGQPGYNCVLPGSNEQGTLPQYTCQGARERARALSGIQPSSPVRCPAASYQELPTSEMMNLNGLSDLAAYAGQNLRINDRARLLASLSTYNNGPFASAATKGVTRIGTDTKLKTLITDGASVQFAHRYTVSSVLAGSNVAITAQDNANLLPITTRGINVPFLAVTSDFPSAKYADIRLEPYQVFPAASGTIVTPGSYVGSVTLKNGSVLRLGSGRYFFDSLDVQTGGILQMNHAAGHVEVYVRSYLNFSGKIQNAAGNEFANFFVYSGEDTAQILEAFSGTLVAPRGSINLQNKVHRGAFYAGKNLELHQGGAIEYQPLVCNH